MVLGSLFAITALLGLFISNTATAVLMAPVALAIADDLHASPYPFAMIVALAASTAFMTPISSPVNTLVVGPGNYAFGDFVRIGVPFSVAGDDRERADGALAAAAAVASQDRSEGGGGRPERFRPRRCETRRDGGVGRNGLPSPRARVGAAPARIVPLSRRVDPGAARGAASMHRVSSRTCRSSLDS